jgi:hypothetical protein
MHSSRIVTSLSGSGVLQKFQPSRGYLKPCFRVDSLFDMTNAPSLSAIPEKFRIKVSVARETVHSMYVWVF